MSDGLIGVIAVCVTVLMVVAMICWTRLRMRGPLPQGLVSRHGDLAPQEAQRLHDEFQRAVSDLPPPAAHNAFYEEDEDVAKVQAAFEAGDKATTARRGDPDEMGPLPVDPERPPKVVTYKRRSTAPPPSCFCHGRQVQENQTVLMWPIPDSQEVRLYCQNQETV